LLALLMAIFERLRNLKFNFGAMFDFGFDLDKLSFDLCDWINQVEFGSNLTDTLTGEASKMFGPLNPKDKVKALGDDLSGKGILNPFAKNDKDFKQQYTSIITEEEKAQLKAAGASFGSMGLSLNKGSDQVATMGFDPLTGLFRNKEQSPFSSNFNFSKANVASVNVAKDAGEINYASFGSGVSFGAAGATGSSGTSGSSGISTGAILTQTNNLIHHYPLITRLPQDKPHNNHQIIREVSRREHPTKHLPHKVQHNHQLRHNQQTLPRNKQVV